MVEIEMKNEDLIERLRNERNEYKKQISILRTDRDYYKQRNVQNRRNLVTIEHLRSSTILSAVIGFVLGLLVQGLVRFV